MRKKEHKKISIDELKQLIRRRKRQIAFDTYPKDLQDFMTKKGLNPYMDDVETRIEYRDFTVSAERK